VRIAVTGAAGFIGSHLAEALTAGGHDVVGIDSLTPYYSREAKLANARAIVEAGAAFHELDLSSPDLPGRLEGIDAVYHLAAQPGLSETVPYATYVSNNLDTTESLLRAARASSVQRFVYVSTSSVYGADATVAEDAEVKPTSNYGITKHAAEQLVLAAHRQDGFPACSMRLYSVCGPRERPEKLYPKLIRHLLYGERFVLFEGSEAHRRSFTHVADIVDGLVTALDRWPAAEGQIFNIGNETDHTTAEGIDIVCSLVGKAATPERMPARRGDQERTRAIIDKARDALDYRPRRSLAEALADEVSWFRSSSG
jgi:UDP-glucuronate 4-epimerase